MFLTLPITQTLNTYIMTTSMIIVFTFGLIGFIYCMYQIARIDKIWWIRMDWNYLSDKRFFKYSIDEMLDINKKNWFGLKWPMDKDFK